MLEILLAQRSRKPRSQVQDYLKTIYQSEFGSGHMVEDAAESLERLQKELAGCGRAEEAFEQIGGGLARLNLGAIEELGLRAQTVNALFVEASNLSRGSDAGLEEKLEALRQGAAALGLDAAQVEREIESWRARGYSAPSHSQEYRRAYAPAYRLVPEAARRFVRLFAAIDALLAREGRARVAIDGNCAAGKSTLGALLALKKKGMKIPTSAVRAGLADVHWPGRLEYFGHVLLDGAHNDPGVRALCGYLDKWMPKENTVLISAMMRDKETEKMCQRLAPRVRCVVCTQPNIPRAMPTEELARAFEAQGLRAYARTHVRDALEEARRLAGPEGNVVCAGSLYLIGEMRTLLRMERGNVGTPSQTLPET